MKYEKYTIETITAAEDIIVSTLADLGIEGALIEDNVPLSEDELAGMFVDIMPEGPEDDGKAYISFYLDVADNNEPLMIKVRETLDEMREHTDLGTLRLTVSETADEDYLNNWKNYFHQFYIDDILFIPSWEEEEDPDHDGPVVHIDPGMAFGTGMHETTSACIRLLRQFVTKGCRVLDVGTGSGVLAVLSFMFGAGEVVATDLDECAVEATKENLAANGLSDADFRLIIGNLIDDESVKKDVGEGYDIVVANILAQVLIPLMPEGIRCLKPGGVYIMSGIIDDKEEEMVAACEEHGLKVVRIRRDGEWVGLAAIKS